MYIILNKGQQKVVDDSIRFFNDPNEMLFEIDGSAGTGKSTVLKYILEANRISPYRVAPMSYTGSASIVLKLNGFPHARTIHSWLYKPARVELTDSYGNPIYNTYYNRVKMIDDFEPVNIPASSYDAILVDEAGTAPMPMRKHIMSQGIKVIATGDLNQLPPIHGESAFLHGDNVHHLTEIMRQKYGSNLLYLAERAKRGLPIQYGFYGDCLVIDEDDLSDEMIMRSDVIICGTNKTRDKYNKHVREIKGIKTDLPQYGERVIFRKNNYNIQIDGINIANGLLGVVVNQPDPSTFDGKTFSIDFMPLLFNRVFRNVRCNFKYFTAPYEEKEAIKKNKYSVGEMCEFGYAITTHLSQGMSLNNGIFIEEYLSPEINDKLKYVGITRFKHGMIYVKRKKKYFALW